MAVCQLEETILIDERDHPYQLVVYSASMFWSPLHSSIVLPLPSLFTQKNNKTISNSNQVDVIESIDVLLFFCNVR